MMLLQKELYYNAQQQVQQQELDSSSGDESSSDDVDICHNSIMKPKKQRNLFFDHIHTAIEKEEERRHVTFPAQEIVSHIKGGGNNNNERIIKTIEDAVAIQLIPHFSDYNEEQRLELWYTQDEMDTMRSIYLSRCSEREQQRERNQLLDLIEEQGKLASSVRTFFSFLSPTKRRSSSIWCTRKQTDCFFPSNDENLVDIYFDDCSRMTKEDDDDSLIDEDEDNRSGRVVLPSKTPQNDDDDDDDDNDDDDDLYHRSQLYETSVAAVLNEQHKQRVMYQHMYGRAIVKGQHSILDPDRIAQVYTEKGDTQQCQHIAEVSATKNAQYNILQEQQQQQQQRDVDDDDDDDDDDVSKDYPDLNHNDELQDQQDDEGGDEFISSVKSGIIDNNTDTTDTTTCIGCNIIGDSSNYSSIISKPSASASSQQQLHCKHPFTFLRTFDVCIDSSSFRTLLRPILQLSQGDIFLENIGGKEIHL